MEAIAQLEHAYFHLRYGYGNGEACVDWASERLQLDQEGDDLDVVLLAGARGRDEVLPLVEAIIERHCTSTRLDDEFLAGKHVAALHADYLQGQETAGSVDGLLSVLSPKLGYPIWLAMLARNCEYATDIPEFKESFEREFAYIASLWSTATSKAEFYARYSREISNQHDANLAKTPTPMRPTPTDKFKVPSPISNNDIRVGESHWIAFRNLEGRYHQAVAVDAFLVALLPLWEALEQNCVVACCGLEAFNFYPEAISEAAKKLKSLNLRTALDDAMHAIEALDTTVVSSTRLNNLADKQTFIELLFHVKSCLPSS